MALIDRIYWKSEGRYGSPRVHKALEMQGLAVSRKRVARLMRAAGLVGRVTQATRKQPGLKRFKAAGENLLLAKAAPDGINQVWVADVTYIKVKQKWRYLAIVMDVYSRRIIDCSLGERRTTALT